MGADLNYEVSGDRRSPAVVFLHGFMGSSADLRGIMAVIEDHTFRIAVDLPGHGTRNNTATWRRSPFGRSPHARKDV